MRKNDLIRSCLQNLRRRRSRTLLTVLGVVVGCCSVVIMVSIGIGMKDSQERMLAEMGDLTMIQVYPAGSGESAAKLNAEAMKNIAMIPGVVASTPKLSLDTQVTLYAGRDRRYRAEYATVVGMDLQALEKMGYQLTEGAYPSAKEALAGENLAYSFSDTKRPSGFNTVDRWAYDGQNMPEPYFNVLKEQMELELRLGDDDKKKGEALTLSIAGRAKEDYNKGYETAEGLIVSISELERLQLQHNRLTGKASNARQGYQSALVKTNAIQDIEQVEKAIQAMGFSTSSMESIRKPMEKEARQKQMMLGGLGAVSLMVAALGITNTMIMSISERTREIGIMKSLGCYVRDIRTSFLLEAGCIGFIGGTAGILISLLTSFTINVVSSTTALDSLAAMHQILTGPRISIIPLWLVLFALLFSILIGVCAGYYPANKAVGISALEAMRQ